MEITRRHITAALTLLAVIVGAILLDRWIVTGKERVSRAVEAMTDACRTRDVEGLFAHISRRYDDGVLDYDSLRALTEAFFKLYGPVEARARHTVVGMNDRRATADVTIVARSSEDDLVGTSQWRMDFEKDASGDWKLVSLTPVEINRQKVSGWGEVVHIADLR
jgi:hypothetical protein